MSDDNSPNENDALVSRVAEAIYNEHVKQAREKAVQYDFQFERLRRVFTTARAEPDRSASILIFALAEDLMLSCFRRNLNPQVKGGWDDVTSGNGLLATANDRITLLELLSWVRPTIIADLRLLKSIRNRFAHHADVDSFTDQKVLGWVTSLTPLEKPVMEKWPEPERISWRKLTPREIFLLRACSVITMLTSDLAVGPAARKAGVHPKHVEGPHYDVAPEPMKEVFRLVADCVLAILPPREIGSAPEVSLDKSSDSYSPNET